MRSGTESGGSIRRSRTPTGPSPEMSPFVLPKADSERTTAHSQVGFPPAFEHLPKAESLKRYIRLQTCAPRLEPGKSP